MAGAVGKNRERATGMIWGQNEERDQREREREREEMWMVKTVGAFLQM